MEQKEARIIVKMNALVDPDLIRALYRASQAGVKIDLILRGMHQGIHHVGKVPKGYEAIHARDEQLEELRVRLESAIQEENYEDAAQLRDEIRRLETFKPSTAIKP